MIKAFSLLVPTDEVLDIETSPFLAEALENQIGNAKRIIVSLRYVKLVDSMGLACLITAHKKIEEKGGAIIIVNVSDHVQQLFTMVKLDHLIQVFNTIDEAL